MRPCLGSPIELLVEEGRRDLLPRGVFVTSLEAVGRHVPSLQGPHTPEPRLVLQVMNGRRNRRPALSCTVVDLYRNSYRPKSNQRLQSSGGVARVLTRALSDLGDCDERVDASVYLILDCSPHKRYLDSIIDYPHWKKSHHNYERPRHYLGEEGSRYPRATRSSHCQYQFQLRLPCTLPEHNSPKSTAQRRQQSLGASEEKEDQVCTVC